MAGITNWPPRASTVVLPGNSLFRSGPVALIFNIRTGHVSPLYHVFFGLATVEHMRKGAVPENLKNLV